MMQPLPQWMHHSDGTELVAVGGEVWVVPCCHKIHVITPGGRTLVGTTR